MVEGSGDSRKRRRAESRSSPRSGESRPINPMNSKHELSMISIRSFLQEQDIRFEEFPEHGVARFGVSLESLRLEVLMIAPPNSDHLIVRTKLPNHVPQDKRPRVVELITRANLMFRVGCLTMDHSDGEIGYRTAVDVEGMQLNSTILRNLLHAALAGIQQFHEAIMKLIYSDADVEQCIEDAMAGHKVVTVSL